MSDPRGGPASPVQPEPLDVTLDATGPDSGGPDPDDAGPDDAGSRAPSRRRLVVLGTLLAIGLAGAAVLGIAGWRIREQQDASLATPGEVVGLRRDDSGQARVTADYLRTAFAADIEVDGSIGAVYTDPRHPSRSVLLFGGTTLLWQPERELDSLFGLVADDTGRIAELHAVSPGRLGGVMKCGVSTGDDTDIVVCGWADHGSVVLAMFPGREVEESAALLRDIRSAVQSRN